MSHARLAVALALVGVAVSSPVVKASEGGPVPDPSPGPSAESVEDAEALREAARRAARGTGEAVAADAEDVPFTAGALGMQSLNPEISITGDFLTIYRTGGELDDRLDNSFRGLGIHLESYLDPFSKFRAAVPIDPDGAELGEAYFTRFGLLSRFNLTLGKFRQQFGVVNRWHKHALDQADFPLPLRQIFGPGGLNQIGASLEWQLPALAGAAQELTLELTDADNPRLFGGNTRNFPSFLGHYKNYRDLSKDLYLEVHLSGLAGRNDMWTVLDPGGQVSTSERRLWTTVLGGGWTAVWEPTERMRYRNWVWRTELYWVTRDLLAPDGSGKVDIQPWGSYSYVQARMSRTLEVGLRGDYFEPDFMTYPSQSELALSPLAVPRTGARQWLVAPYFTWNQSPWVHWRLEWNHLFSRRMGADEDAVHLQCVFAAGPHKHERY